jgi:hypothetical protein
MTSSLLPRPDYDHDALVEQLSETYDRLDRLMKNLDNGIQDLGDPSRGNQDYATGHAHEFIKQIAMNLAIVAAQLSELQFHTQHGPSHPKPATLGGLKDEGDDA